MIAQAPGNAGVSLEVSLTEFVVDAGVAVKWYVAI